MEYKTSSTRHTPNTSPKREYSARSSKFCSTVPISPHTSSAISPIQYRPTPVGPTYIIFLTHPLCHFPPLQPLSPSFPPTSATSAHPIRPSPPHRSATTSPPPITTSRVLWRAGAGQLRGDLLSRAPTSGAGEWRRVARSRGIWRRRVQQVSHPSFLPNLARSLEQGRSSVARPLLFLRRRPFLPPQIRACSILPATRQGGSLSLPVAAIWGAAGTV
jgi:hypothetical protein